MRKKATRAAALVMILTQLVIIASCGSEEQPIDTATTTETQSQTTESEVTTALPADLDFGGAECRIFNFDSGSWNTQLLAETQTGEVLNDAIYNRNIKVEDTLNVRLTEFRESEWNTAYEAARRLLASGDDAYEIYFTNDRNALSLAQEGYIEPLSDMPYVDLDREYWSQTINEDISIHNKLYFSYGDFNLTGYEAVNVLLVNKQLAEEYSLPDHYDAVLDGSWTLDLLAENMKLVTNDLDGNGTFDENDQYGITSHNKQVLPCFWVASGLRTIEKNENDEPYFALPGNEKFADMYEKVLDIMYTDNVYFNSASLTNYADNTVFKEGRALYNIVRVAFMTYYRDMDYDYAIIPYPKWDENQTEYYSRFEGGAVSFTPKVAANKELAGAVMELMACESMKTVIPVYYDTVLKNKYARDERSIEMLDLIYENRICDLGDTFWSNQIRDGVFAGKFAANDRDLQSTIATMEPTVNKVIEDTIAAFDETDAAASSQGSASAE